MCVGQEAQLHMLLILLGAAGQLGDSSDGMAEDWEGFLSQANTSKASVCIMSEYPNRQRKSQGQVEGKHPSSKVVSRESGSF